MKICSYRRRPTLYAQLILGFVQISTAFTVMWTRQDAIWYTGSVGYSSLIVAIVLMSGTLLSIDAIVAMYYISKRQYYKKIPILDFFGRHRYIFYTIGSIWLVLLLCAYSEILSFNELIPYLIMYGGNLVFNTWMLIIDGCIDNARSGRQTA